MGARVILAHCFAVHGGVFSNSILSAVVLVFLLTAVMTCQPYVGYK